MRYADADGLPVLGSARTSDFALLEAVYLIHHMVGARPEIVRAMATNKIRFVVMAPTEMTTDVPEHHDLEPKTYWDRRARGLGATKERPAVSCGEENLLELPGDPYFQENILVHEFAHSVHEHGMRVVDPTFDGRLAAAYENARAKGLWSGTYAMTNRMEYWAEGAQSWFDTNRVNDAEHGPIDTRDKLRPYDPELAGLLTEVFGDRAWRYVRPSKRTEAERAHLAGFQLASAGRFAWPALASGAPSPLPLLAYAAVPLATPRAVTPATSVQFVNHRRRTVTVDWRDFDGAPKRYADLKPGQAYVQSTYSGHVWVVAEDGHPIGGFIGGVSPGLAEIP